MHNYQSFPFLHKTNLTKAVNLYNLLKLTIFAKYNYAYSFIRKGKTGPEGHPYKKTPLFYYLKFWYGNTLPLQIRGCGEHGRWIEWSYSQIFKMKIVNKSPNVKLDTKV